MDSAQQDIRLPLGLENRFLIIRLQHSSGVQLWVSDGHYKTYLGVTTIKSLKEFVEKCRQLLETES